MALPAVASAKAGLVFDKNWNLITPKSGYMQVSQAAKETGTDIPHERLFSPALNITEPGYVYIYVSNEDPTAPKDVFFDDFSVTQVKTPIVQVEDYYPFGLTFNSYSRENSTPNMYQYNGKELQDELSLGWLDYTARQYDPSIARFLSVDPAADTYRNWTLYHYTMNNPIIFVDPTGAFTELFDGNGKKIGEDANGNDGKVSIVTDKDNADRIKANTKNGEVATAEDVASGTLTTKTVLTEALDVLSRTNANGGLREEVSLVTGNGEIVRGPTGAEPTYAMEGGVLVQTARTNVPALPAGAGTPDQATTIHSHPTEIAEHGGQAFPQSASTPSTADRGTFTRYGTNIIVGPIGVAASVSRDTNGKLITSPSRSNGAVIYQGNRAPTALTEGAMRRIIR